MRRSRDIEKIAFDLVVAKLDSQRSDLQNVRNQAAISAAVTGLLATTFASILDSSGKLTFILGDALLGFSIGGALLLATITASLAFSVLVVISWSNFNFSFNTSKLIEEGRIRVFNRDYLKSYVDDGEWYFQDNERKISSAQTKLWWAMVLGWVQIFPWLFLMAGEPNVR